MVLIGIDVSHQQSLSDWSPDGLDFIFIKATEGSSYVDPMYSQHLAKAINGGVPLIGSYHYANAIAPIAAQVDLFLKITSGAGLLAFDTEHGQGIVTLSKMQQWYDTIHSFGKKCLHYASEDQFPQHVGQDGNWVANYSAPHPNIPYVIHQYGPYKGVDGNRSPLTLEQLGALSNPMAQAKITDVTPATITRGTTWYDIDGVTVVGVGHSVGDSYSPYAAGNKRAFYAGGRIYLCVPSKVTPIPPADTKHTVTVDVDGATAATITV